MKASTLVVLAGLTALGHNAEAAPPVPYGGEALAYVFGRPVTTAPNELTTIADAAAQGAIYERLYRFLPDGSLVPELAAGAPIVDGRTVTVPLRTGVPLHDGRTLTPEMVAEALRRQIVVGSAAAYVGAMVSGANEHFEAKNPPLGIRARGTNVVFELAVAHSDFPRVLATRHALIMVPAAGRAGALGTGPFRFDTRGARGEVTLVPFLRHARGRPYLDRLIFRPHASRFGAASIAKTSEAAFVFGVPDTSNRATSPLTAWPTAAGPTPIETVVLAVGPTVLPAAGRAALVAAIDGALNRRRLVDRFLGPDAVATSRLLDFKGAAKLDGAARMDPTELTLLVARDGRAGHRFAERVQLDLLRVGVTVRIERVSAKRLERRRRTREYELLLDTVRSGAPSTAESADTLHGLLSIAASMGVPGAVGPSAFDAYVRAPAARRRVVLDRIESDLRAALGLVPIARRAPAFVIDPSLRGIVYDLNGRVGVADAYRR